MTTVARTLGELRELGAEIGELDLGYPVDPASFEPGASPERLRALRQAAGAPLPADYEELLAACAGFTGMDFHNGYALHPPELVELLLAADGPPKYLVVDGRRERALAIGGDGGGNLFLLEVAPPFRVLKWHPVRSSGEESCSPEAPCLTLLARGFSAFLERVAADWRHFLRGGDSDGRTISG